MKCPVDDTLLQMTDRQGIEIDYCPQCRGVWLDRGELDKLIDRSTAGLGARPPGAASYPPDQPRYEEPRYDTPRHEEHRHDERSRDRRDDRHYDSKYAKKRRKESFLGDLFDF